MAFEIDIGFASAAGRKEQNEDFCAAMQPQSVLEEGWGAIAAIADGVSTGGMGKEAAQTSVTSLVRDYYGTPETWDTTVALDRIIAAQNAWLCGINKRRHPVLGLTTLTALVTVVCAASLPMPPVLTPSAIAAIAPQPSSGPFWGSMAAQKSSLWAFRPATLAKPMSISNAMHQHTQLPCPNERGERERKRYFGALQHETGYRFWHGDCVVYSN